MPESGGPANQSGILYQNGVAARYLGRLCDGRERPNSDKVVEVRVEAPGPVDDIVVTYADGHTDWVQAKEHVAIGSVQFTKLMQGYCALLDSDTFRIHDHLILVTDDEHQGFRKLEELARRAKGARTFAELSWSLGQPYVAVIDRVRDCIQGDDDLIFRLLQTLFVEILAAEGLERDIPPLWMPESSVAPITLFCLLRDQVAIHARVRRAFTSSELRSELAVRHNITLYQEGTSTDVYRATLSRLHAELSVIGTRIGGRVDVMYVAPTLRVVSEEKFPTNARQSDEFDLATQWSGDRITFDEFRIESGDRILLTAGAGFGKSELIRAIARREAQYGRLPVIVSLPDLLQKETGIMGYLESMSTEFAVRIPWESVCSAGEILLLIDGFDELTDAERSNAAQVIRLFSARFGSVPWLIASRDGAAGFLGNMRELAIEPLGDTERRELCRRWLPDKSALSTVVGTLTHNRELSRLTRIPLFLALLVDQSIQAQGNAPKHRHEVLAEYVRRLLSAGSIVSKREFDTSSRILEMAAELLALLVLDEARAEVHQGEVLNLLAGAFGDAKAEQILHDLVRSGLLRRRGPRICFSFALVGEYLAGRALVVKRKTQLGQLIHVASTRPWIQAMQFVLETTENADGIAHTILGEVDDAFCSKTLLLARAISNGAVVGASVRAVVRERLGALWLQAPFGGHGLVTALLADGFSQDLPGSVRDVLAKGERLHFGGDALLVAAQDDELTRQAIVAHFDGFGFTFGTLLPAIERVSKEFVTLAIERARKPRFNTAMELVGIACLLRELETMPDELRAQIMNDEALHPGIRLSTMMHQSGPLDDTATALVEQALNHVFADRHATRSYVYVLCEEALWRLPNAEHLWRQYLINSELSVEWRRVLLFSIASRRPTSEAIAALESLRRECSSLLPAEVATLLLLTLAYLGNRSAMVEITRQISSLAAWQIRSWIVVSSRYNGDEIVNDGLQALKGAELTSDEKADLTLSIGMVMRYEIETFDLSGGMSGRYRRFHAASQEAANVLCDWAEKAPTFGRLELLAYAAELGDETAFQGLGERLGEIISKRLKPPIGERDPRAFRADRALSYAVHVLSRRAPISISTLAALAGLTSFNLPQAVCRALADHGSQEALEALLTLQGVPAMSMHEQFVVSAAERLSQTLGITIDRNSAGRLVMRQRAPVNN